MLDDKKLFAVVGTKLFLLLTVFLSGAVGNIYTHTGNIQFLFNNEHRSVLFIQQQEKSQYGGTRSSAANNF